MRGRRLSASTRSDADAGPDAGADAGVLVIGLGNLLVGDEGLGVQVLRRLETDYGFDPAVTLVDGGTSGLDLLPLFADYRRILLIDAVAGEGPPGSVTVLRDEAILRVLSQKLSVHHLGVTDVLALAQLLGYPAAEIVLVGVVPAELGLGLQLSPTVARSVPAIIEQLGAVLAEWGVTVRAKERSIC
ncbi:MAG: HyaD/HybD family hydrogenase maturation endopeptidase [Lamprocystis purpurea]|nr:HyaD/HybD family hydrogenase maturation endopeptidase [Lamprocystis purpurea]